MGTKIDHPETRELAAYGQLIIHLSRKHQGRGWLVYDTLFRQQKAAGSLESWNELNSSLVSSAVVSRDETRSCAFCFAVDHSSSECALGSTDLFKALKGGAPRSSPTEYRSPSEYRSPTEYRSPRFKPYRANDGICRRFNRGSCGASNCKFEHACSVCFEGSHRALECPRARRKSSVPAAPAK